MFMGIVGLKRISLSCVRRHAIPKARGIGAIEKTTYEKPA
jgi:hypothetical protein